MFTTAELSLIYSALRVASMQWSKLHAVNTENPGGYIDTVFAAKAAEALVLRKKIEEIFETGQDLKRT